MLLTGAGSVSGATVSNVTRWEVRGRDAYIITYVEGEPIRCSQDIDWNVVLATDYDALEAEFASYCKAHKLVKDERDQLRALLQEVLDTVPLWDEGIDAGHLGNRIDDALNSPTDKASEEQA